MGEYLDQINKVITEHQKIKGHLKLIGDSMSDEEALIALKSVHSELTPNMKDKLTQLEQVMGSLKEGIMNHFNLEAAVLPPILGNVLMQALLNEHEAILEQIDQANRAIFNAQQSNLTRKQILKETEFKQVINYLSQIIEEHAVKEELMLEMVKKVLQEENVKKDREESEKRES